MKTEIRVCAAITICIPVGALGIVFSTYAVGNLVQCSMPLVNVEGWWKEDALVNPYSWLSDTTLFSHSGWWRLSAPFTYDLNTKTKTPLNKLQKLFGSDGEDNTAFWEISPDRQHVTSGKDRLACIGDIYDASHRLIRIHNGETDTLVLAYAATELQDDTLEVQQATVSGLPGQPTWMPIHQPAGTAAGVEAIPDRKHLAWLVTDEHTPLLARLVHRFLPKFDVSPKRWNSIWISGIDGSDAREVGRVEVTDDVELQFLQWMPDGKRVSYIYNDVINAVDVRDSL